MTRLKRTIFIFTCNGHISQFSHRCTNSDLGISRICGKQIVSLELFAVSIVNDIVTCSLHDFQLTMIFVTTDAS